MSRPDSATPQPAGFSTAAAAEQFEALRSYLHAVAYRIVSEVGVAEDLVQDAWLRWERAGFPAEATRSYLTRVVSRLGLDYLKSARVRRESYVGEWLAEPEVTLAHAEGGSVGAVTNPSPLDVLVRSQQVSTALMRVAETLTPAERTVFILREVFDVDYDDIAAVVDRTPQACRKVYSRAGKRVGEAARFCVDVDVHERLVGALAMALSSGDINGLSLVLADDVVWHSDGGGKAVAFRVPQRGAERIVHLLQRLKANISDTWMPVFARSGQYVCIVGVDTGRVDSVMTFSIRHGLIYEIQSMRNPDKLARVQAAVSEAGRAQG